MKLISEFTKLAPNQVFLSIVLGAVAGVCYSSLIPLVMLAIQPNSEMLETVTPEVTKFLNLEVSHFKIATVFVIACLGTLLLRSLSEIILIRVSNEVAKKIRCSFYERISAAPISEIERIGSARLIASINIDVPNIVEGGSLVPIILVNVITLFGILSFIYFLNFEIFKLIMYAILFGVLCYQVPMWLGTLMLRRSREVQDDLQASINGLIYGAKELKLDIYKRKYFYQHMLLEKELSILKNSNNGHALISTTASFGDLICFFVIGFVGFVFINYHSIEQQELVGIIMALLYVTGPVAMLLHAIPGLSFASVSYHKLNKLIASMNTEDNEDVVKAGLACEVIEYKNVEYSYPSCGEEEGFKIGPINLKMKKGEVIFVVGANGSGKSTFSKLLTLHYLPTAGDIYFGDSLVDASSIVTHRMEIAAIYTDFHLFDSFLNELDDKTRKNAQSYLIRLGLADKVALENERFSTIALSDGQRKRLALLLSFLEDKSFYLFDEWAADQDPVFKRFFYDELLGELKNKGKLVVVISHDEHYFYAADRILVMEQGQLKQMNKDKSQKLEVT